MTFTSESEEDRVPAAEETVEVVPAEPETVVEEPVESPTAEPKHECSREAAVKKAGEQREKQTAQRVQEASRKRTSTE